MANIQERRAQDGTTSYRVQVRLKGHPAESATFQRKTDARLWAQQTEAAIREGRYFRTAQARRHTMADAIDRYKAEVLPRKPKSVAIQTRQLDWWKERIGHLPLVDVTPAVIAGQRAVLVEGNGEADTAKSPATANRYMAVLSHLFTVCVREWGWMDDTPIRKIGRLKEPRGRVRYLSDEERKNLLAACKASTNPHLYHVVVVALSTGCRKGEIMTLRWQDVDLRRGQITLLDTKNGEARSVPLVGHALECMRARNNARQMDMVHVFPQRKGDAAYIDRAFRQARDAAGIKDFRFHDLRHSAASYLAMNGATLAEIAEVLGHKTLAMVKRYSHLSDAHTSSVVARMNAAVFADGDGADETTQHDEG